MKLFSLISETNGMSPLKLFLANLFTLFID